MANYCYYHMKVVGDSRENLERFYRAMRREGEFSEWGVGRIYWCEMDDEIEQRDDGRYEMTVNGDCAWSILTSMVDVGELTFPHGLLAQSEKLNLDIEAFSEENGFAFQEHYLFSKGEQKIGEYVDWYEIDVSEGIDDEEVIKETIRELCAENYIKTGNYRDYISDGFMRLGGYESWEFQI